MTGVLVLLAVVIGYGLLCLVKPTKRCGKCKGTRMIRKGKGRKTRALPCPRCRAHGRHYRRGATTVHRWFWAAFGDRLKAHLKRGSD